MTGTLISFENGAPYDLLFGDPFGTCKCLQCLFEFRISADRKCHSCNDINVIPLQHQ